MSNRGALKSRARRFGSSRLSLRGFVYGLYARRLRRRLDPKKLPGHVALIIDGNRRWARQLGVSDTSYGHQAGASKVLEFLNWCDELGLRMVTLYLLSHDNLARRDPTELCGLCKTIAELIGEVSGNWRAVHVGSRSGLPEIILRALDGATASPKDSKLQVNLAIGYGARREITEAVRKLVASHIKAGLPIEELPEKLSIEQIAQHLYTRGMPDPDLIIRTSGEQRLSDFMLWQGAHSELYFVEALGPDLRQIDFFRALRDYSRRQRRYGA